MQIGHDRFPHKYIQKVKRDGKTAYIYAAHNEDFNATVKNAAKHMVVMNHGKPTQIVVAEDGTIISGPPVTLGRTLCINTDKAVQRFGTAKDPSGELPDIYFYPEDYLKTVRARKAAKFVKAVRALKALDIESDKLMQSRDPVKSDYGLAVYLNNNTQMRIGAHGDASSIDPKVRQNIIARARSENWDAHRKNVEMQAAQQGTFGLLSLRLGHVSVEPDGKHVSFRFMGKGGKENFYTAEVSPQVWFTLLSKKRHPRAEPGDRLFHPEVNYKKVWRMYKKYDSTPHISRGAYAERMVKQLMEDHGVVDAPTANAAVKKFDAELKKISTHLNHTQAVMQRSYLAPNTKKALDEYREALRARYGHLAESNYGGITENLGEAILWLDLGLGNTVI